MDTEKRTPAKKKFRIKYLLYSLIPVLAFLFLAEALASILYYQMRGKSTFAIMSVMDYAGKKARGEKIQAPPAARFIRLPEHPKSYEFSIVPPAPYLANADNLEGKPYLTRTDENAFILPAKMHENPELVIAFLGGSTTECRFNEEEARFPYRAGRLLEEKTGKRVNSYNNGINSITSMNSLNIFISKVLALKPHYAVLMHNINDMNLLVYEGSYWNDHPLRSLLVDPNNPRFSDPKYQADEWADARGKAIAIDSARVLEDFSNSLRSFVAVARAWEVQPVLMTQASRFTENPDNKILGQAIAEWKKNDLTYAQVKNLYDAMNERIRQTAASEKVPLIDLAAQIPQTKEYMYDLVHFTDKGAMSVAEIISRTFEEKILSGTPN
jgi:lysophospholipase L1-like esterase